MQSPNSSTPIALFLPQLLQNFVNASHSPECFEAFNADVPADMPAVCQEAVANMQCCLVCNDPEKIAFNFADNVFQVDCATKVTRLYQLSSHSAQRYLPPDQGCCSSTSSNCGHTIEQQFQNCVAFTTATSATDSTSDTTVENPASIVVVSSGVTVLAALAAFFA